MRTLVKATVLGLGLLTSGTAMTNDNFGGSPLYNPQYSYFGPPYDLVARISWAGGLGRVA
jgi:hypothetical protein